MRKISGRFGAVARTTALLGMLLATTIASPAQTFTTLATFNGSNGNYPYAGLVQGTDGSLYGTTLAGGANGSCAYYYGGPYGCGTVYKIGIEGTLTTLYSFCAQTNCADGGSPGAQLVLGTDGNFYGTTQYGESNQPNSFCFLGCGTVFKITPSGTLTTLYSFCSQVNCADGGQPIAGLIEGHGNFYGVTYIGGANDGGTVFTITPTGSLTTLYSFCSQPNCTDGGAPVGALIQATDGNFYGTTVGSGDDFGGTVFKITPGGTFTTLHRFDFNDGARPYGPLVQASEGNFYGTTFVGGLNDDGTVFRMTPGGVLSTLHSFDGGDGENP